jgi:hypothetical protein
MGSFLFVTIEKRMFGLRVVKFRFAFVPPSPPKSEIGFSGASNRTQPEWDVVTRYRSATVAGLHGLPRISTKIYVLTQRTRRTQRFIFIFSVSSIPSVCGICVFSLLS